MWFQQITHTGVACVTLCLIYLCARMPLYTVCVWYLAKQSAICRLFPTFVLTHKENEVGWLHSSRAWIDTFLKYVNKSVQKKHSDWTAATVWTRAAVFLTFCAEARAGGEAGHIDDLYSKLLACVPVNAAPHHTEGTPATHTHTSWVSHRRRQKTHTQIWNMIFQRKMPRFSWHIHTVHWADIEPFLRTGIIASILVPMGIIE